MTIEDTLSGFSTTETIIFAVVGSVLITVIIYIGTRFMTKRLWRPKDKTKPRNIYECTVCGVPFTTQIGLVTHMKSVHGKSISMVDAKTKAYEVSYEEWEQLRLDEESKLEEFQDEQNQIDERAINQLTGNPDDDPENIVDPTTTKPPTEIYNEVSEKIEKPVVTMPSEGVFNVQYRGDRIELDIAMTVPNTPEVIDAINKLNEAMGK